jgi:glutamate dehydrogenase
MGITARGAWESVKRHFREMDVDIGRRRSPCRRRRHVGRRVRQRHAAGATIKLVAAFDHRDIFIDPAPIPEKLRRAPALFDLPRSSWQDYDRTLISRAAACSRAR